MIETALANPERSDRLLRWIIASCFIASLLLIWIPAYLPLVDYPEHMLAIQVLAHPHDSGRDYSIELHNVPYLTCYILGMILNRIFPIFWTGKIILSLYLVLTPLSVLAYLKSLSLPSWPGLLVFAFLFNLFFYLGSLNFLLSIPFAFFTLAGILRWLIAPMGVGDTTNQLKTNWIHPFVIMLSSLILLYTHLVTFGVVILAIFAMIIFRSVARIRIGRVGIAMGPSLVLSCLMIGQEHLRSPGGLSPSWQPFPFRLFDLLQPFLIYRDDYFHMRVIDRLNLPLAILALCLLAVSLIWMIHKIITRSTPTAVGFKIAWLVFLVFLIAALIFPSQLPSASFAHRLSILVLLASLALIPRKVSEAFPAKLIFVVAVLFSFVTPAVRFMAFNSQMQPLIATIQRMEPDSRVLPLIHNPHSRHLQGYAFLHAVNYYHLVRGGSSPYLFFRNMPQMPVRYRFLSELTPVDEFNPDLFRWEIHHDAYRYFLAREPTPRVLADLSIHCRLIFESEGWYLFERRQNKF